MHLFQETAVVVAAMLLAHLIAIAITLLANVTAKEMLLGGHAIVVLSIAITSQVGLAAPSAIVMHLGRIHSSVLRTPRAVASRV